MLLLLCMFTALEKKNAVWITHECKVWFCSDSLCFHLPPTPLFHPNFLPPFPFLLSILVSDPDVSSLPYKSSHRFTWWEERKGRQTDPCWGRLSSGVLHGGDSTTGVDTNRPSVMCHNTHLTVWCYKSPLSDVVQRLQGISHRYICSILSQGD